MVRGARREPTVVCIGFSAGGLQPFENIVRRLSPHTGMIFVAIPHLHRGIPTHLPWLISQWSEMPAELVHSGLIAAPDHVYVIPPDEEITIDGGYFTARPRSKTRGYSNVITLFVDSLTKNRRPPGIAVILSGMDADGAAALEKFRYAGGITIVQSPLSANHGDMPKSAIHTRCVDYVLPPEDIAAQIEMSGRILAAVA